MLGQLGRAKAEFDKATQGFKSQLASELTAQRQGEEIHRAENDRTFDSPPTEAGEDATQMDLFVSPQVPMACPGTILETDLKTLLGLGCSP
jgi:hypothetical protein